jgi:hypothetical protein
MAYTLEKSLAGLMPITQTDAGYTTANGTALAVPTPPLQPGMIVQAYDPTFGQGEFILLKGVASTAVGSLVVYNTTSYTTTLCPVTANLGQPVAVAMSANTASTSWGWYQISGVAVVAKSTGITFAVNVALGINSVAKVGAVASGKQVLGARTANSATVASATTTVNVVMNRPHMQGRVT